MIRVGIDDTDMPDTPGTNQIARALAAELRPRWRCRLILRHQLLHDPRVPFTSHNSSASLLFDAGTTASADDDALFDALRAGILARCADGSDPGLCLARTVPMSVAAWGARCRDEIVTQDDARALARRHGIRLEGLGGTEGGVIGALAALGLAAGGDHGRVVHQDGVPDDLAGPVPAAEVLARGVTAFLDADTGRPARPRVVDVGKHLRPNVRGGRVVLFVAPSGRDDADHVAVRAD